jgi:hypothetical protein
VGRVANETLNAALRGKAVVIPGAVNRLLQAAGSALPPVLVSGWIGRRWQNVRRQRTTEAALTPVEG